MHLARLAIKLEREAIAAANERHGFCAHLALHTWPEDDYVTLDVYVCSYTNDNSAKAERLFELVMQAFDPSEPHLHRVVRA